MVWQTTKSFSTNIAHKTSILFSSTKWHIPLLLQECNSLETLFVARFSHCPRGSNLAQLLTTVARVLVLGGLNIHQPE